jgi:hypothetical protein
MRFRNYNGAVARAGAALVLCLLLALATGGCKAKPAASAGFADDALMASDPSVPFHKFWRKPGVKLSQYDKLYVAEVNTSYMLGITDWQKGERKDEIERDVRSLGEFTRATFQQAFRDDPNHHFTVLDGPAPPAERGVLVFEFALIEVVPSKVVLNALGYAPFGVGMTLNLLRAVGNDKSSVAFEARARDAATGEVVLLAADREMQQQALIDARGLTWYSHAHGIIRDWAQQFVQVADQQPGRKIKDAPAFRLQPW